MTIFQTSTLLTFIISLTLGTFVYLGDRKKATNKAWFLSAFSISIWSLGLFGVVSAHSETVAMFWQNLLDGAGLFIPIAFFNFVLCLLEIEKKHYRQKLFSWTIGILLFILSLTKLFKFGVIPKFGFNYWIEPGPLYFFFPLTYIFYVTSSLILLIKYFKTSKDQILKAQIKYVLGAVLIGFGGGTTNFFPQIFNIYPVGNYSVVLYVFFISYAMLKHHLFNVKVVATELLTSAIWIFLLIRILVTDNLKDRLIDGGLLVFVVLFGILLIRSVTKEVEQREKLEKLAVELEAANERLRQLDEAKSEFLSIASHQLRTPLTSIKGLLSMLLEEFWGPLNDEQKKYLTQTTQSSDRLLHLIEDLLNISRIEAGRMQFDFKPLNLQELAIDVMKEMEPQAIDKKLYLKVEESDQELPLVKADSLKIRQVIQNLTDNSIKYTEKGGSIIRLLRQDNEILFSINDTGIGLPPGQHLFEKFERGQKATNQHTEGTGLGLYLADKIIKAHGGKIWAESEGEGKGSKFCFTLPIA
jgi:signal transduction histidine kinase